MKAFRRHNRNGEKLQEDWNWKIEKHWIKDYEVSSELLAVLNDNPNVPVYMRSYCSKDFRDKHPDVTYFPPKDI